MTKKILTLLSGLLLVLPLRMITAEDLPKPFSFARYQTMSDRSPFAVATTVAPAETPNFAKDLYIANAAHSKEGDFVTVASSTDRNFKKYLTTTRLVDGYGISAIEWSEKVGATKVTITKDGQSATLGFNEALLRLPATAGQAAGQHPPPMQAGAPPGKAPDGKDVKESKDGGVATSAAAPNVPGAQQNATKPMPVPVLPAQAPRARGVIPRNPSGPSMKAAQPPPQS